ncbi:hypothetical protein FACS1894170_02590 [Planctomycetales bacterium]|nr:hypothetical protein FACS1894170_02590 [Planctomycetales bacterium]
MPNVPKNFGKRRILAVVIAFLIGLPFVVRFFRKPADIVWEVTKEKDEYMLLREKERSQALHGDKVHCTVSDRVAKEFPFPDDIIFLDAARISPDGSKIAVAGGILPHAKIYVAPFPVKSKRDYVEVADMPCSYGIAPLQWGADAKTLYYVSYDNMEMEVSLYQTTDKQDAPQKMRILRTNEDIKAELLVKSGGKPDTSAPDYIKYVMHGNVGQQFGLCNESMDSTYLIDGKMLININAGGEIITSKEVQEFVPASTSIVFLQTNKNGDLLVWFHGRAMFPSKDIRDKGVLDVYYELLKEVIVQPNGEIVARITPAFENCHIVFTNGDKIVGEMEALSDAHRFFVTEKHNLFQRKELRFKKGDTDEKLGFVDLSPDGRYVVYRTYVFPSGLETKRDALTTGKVPGKQECKLFLLPLDV